MKNVKGTKTHENLKAAFAAESQANRRYLYYARTADIEGYPDLGGLFRDTSEAETGHAFGHLDFLKPARFNDLLEATAQVAKRGNASITFAQQIRREGLTLCEGEVKVACLDAATFAPHPIPPRLRAQLDAGEAP